MTVFKVLEGTITSGSTTCTFTDSDILENSILDFYFTDEDVVIDSSDSVVGSASVTINALNHDIGVALFINNVEALYYPIDANNVVYGSSDVGTVLGAIDSEISNINQSIVAHGIAISQKQDQLIAGDNITIEDNVISASGGGTSCIDTSNVLRANAPISSGFEYTATENCVVCIEFRNTNLGGVNVLINNVQILSTYSYSLPSGAFFNSVELLNLKQGDTIKFNPNDSFAPTLVGIYGVH